jgi:hypothetical protein
MKALNLHEFPACCGIKVLTRWGWAKGTASGQEPVPYEVLEADLKEFVGKLETYHGLTLVALEPQQTEQVEYLLKQYKFFPLVKNFYNPNMKSTLTLYGRIQNENYEPLEVGHLKYGKDEKPSDETRRKVSAGDKKFKEPPASVSGAFNSTVISGTPLYTGVYWSNVIFD